MIVKILSPLNHDGRRYEPGETLDLPDDAVEKLPEGVVEPTEPTEGETGSNEKGKGKAAPKGAGK